MKKSQIKFSHIYRKLQIGGETVKEATLLQIFKCNYKELNDHFINYDTWFVDTVKGQLLSGYYALPKTDLLVLLFAVKTWHGTPYIFTTIRRWTPEKEKYYRGLIGKEVEIVIKEVENP